MLYYAAGHAIHDSPITVSFMWAGVAFFGSFASFVRIQFNFFVKKLIFLLKFYSCGCIRRVVHREAFGIV